MKKSRILYLIIALVILTVSAGCVKKPAVPNKNPEFYNMPKENIESIQIKNMTKIYENNKINAKNITDKKDIEKIADVLYNTALYETGPAEVNNVDQYTFVLNYNGGKSKACVLVYDEKYKERIIIDKRSYKIKKSSFEALKKLYGEMNYNEELVDIIGLLV